MIKKETVQQLIDTHLADTRYFLVDLRITADNNITIEIDSADGVDIDTCVALSRHIEEHLDRDIEDYDLEVGSAGLTTPFKILRQWQNSIGRQVEILDAASKKHTGTVIDVTDTHFTIEEQVMARREGDKRKRLYTDRVTFAYDEIKYTKYAL